MQTTGLRSKAHKTLSGKTVSPSTLSREDCLFFHSLREPVGFVDSGHSTVCIAILMLLALECCRICNSGPWTITSLTVVFSLSLPLSLWHERGGRAQKLQSNGDRERSDRKCTLSLSRSLSSLPLRRIPVTKTRLQTMAFQ